MIQDSFHYGSTGHLLAGIDITKQMASPSSQLTPALDVDKPCQSKGTLHVEVRLLQASHARPDSVRRGVRQWLEEKYRSASLRVGMSLLPAFVNWPLLKDNVEAILVAEAVGTPEGVESYRLADIALEIHTYKLQPPSSLSVDSLEEDPVVQILELPADMLEGTWEYLIFDPDIKTKLLCYITTLLYFGDQKVNFNCIGFNRLVLLHGPPGGGKTSLCRALAQKLSIRLSRRYSRTKLVEINTHCLFSKYFSETGKQVGRVFEEISNMLEDEDVFILVLIDEVESLATSRTAMAGNEPTDSLRAVNALLTALDKLRHRRNVIVLTTSNLINAMDLAFLDRADIKQYVGSPNTRTCYAILRSSLNELIRCHIIKAASMIPSAAEASLMLLSQPLAAASILWRIAEECACQHLSGRALRKLPVLVHADTIKQENYSIERALEGLKETVRSMKTEQSC